jgi:hypothetical protein
MTHISDIHWLTVMNTRYPYHEKIIRRYLIVFIIVPVDTKWTIHIFNR